MNDTTKKEIRERFEANMLDGDKINDCGGAMISAEAVLEYLFDELSRLDQERVEKVRGMFLTNTKDESDSDWFYGNGNNQALKDVLTKVFNVEE